MNFDRYVELMQQLITMTDIDNEEEMLCARNILKNLMELARSSQKVNPMTMRAMVEGYHEFSMFMRMKDEFAGKPGDVEGNMAKRKRLAMTLRPGC